MRKVGERYEPSLPQAVASYSMAFIFLFSIYLRLSIESNSLDFIVSRTPNADAFSEFENNLCVHFFREF
jgi:hypothetical protein